MKRVGIIGCGAVGSGLARATVQGQVVNGAIVALHDQVEERARALASQLQPRPIVHPSMQGLLEDRGIDVIVEAASQEAVFECAERALLLGKELMVMSVGALLDDPLYAKVEKAVAQGRGRLYIPSGAIAGLDGIRSAKLSGLDEVVLTSRKSPKSLVGAPYLSLKGIDLSVIKGAEVIYEGPAKEAVKYFPANVNVAAALSLAGIGGERTKVRIVVDPSTEANIHEVYARGPSGEIRVVMNNLLHPENPKTSYLALLSAIETLRSICDQGIRVGS